MQSSDDAVAAALVGVGRIGEAIAQHPVAARERRPDDPRRRCSRRAANISSASVSCVIGCVEQQDRAAPRRAACRPARASRRRDVRAPRARRRATRTCVLLPAPSTPSSVMKRPRASETCGAIAEPAQCARAISVRLSGILTRRDCGRRDSPRTRDVPSPRDDEVQVRRRRRIHHGVERRLRRQRDRRRRQAVARVRVVRRVGLEVALAQVAVERVAHAVDHRRVGLQPHAALQAVDEHRRDQRAVGRRAGFLLDDRREDQRLVRRGERQVGRAARPRGVEPLVQRR